MQLSRHATRGWHAAPPPFFFPFFSPNRLASASTSRCFGSAAHAGFHSTVGLPPQLQLKINIVVVIKMLLLFMAFMYVSVPHA